MMNLRYGEQGICLKNFEEVNKIFIWTKRSLDNSSRLSKHHLYIILLLTQLEELEGA